RPLRRRLPSSCVIRPLLFTPLECATRRPAAYRHLRVGRLAPRARAAMLREQHVALRLSLAELLFELGEGGFQRRDLRALIVDLLAEAVGVPLGALVPLERGAREIVLSFLNGELRLAQPLDRPVGILLRF